MKGRRRSLPLTLTIAGVCLLVVVGYAASRGLGGNQPRAHAGSSGSPVVVNWPPHSLGAINPSALLSGQSSLDERAWFNLAPGNARCNFDDSEVATAVIRRAREQRLRDKTTEQGHADKVEHLLAPEKVLKPASLSPSDYRFSADARTKFACEGVAKIGQGSFRIEAALAVLAHLTKVQVANGVTGAIGEVGVHHGLFFVGLAHLAQKGEGLYAADVFESQELNVDGSGNGDRQAFMTACSSNGIAGADMTVVAGSTADLDSLGSTTYRMFSVDAGHTRELTYNDMTLAACHLSTGGIIVLDDVLNTGSWPGVIDGMFSWLHYFPIDFAPFFVGYNKVLLCHRDWHKTYYSALNKWMGSVQAADLGLTGHSFTNDNPHKASTSGTNEFMWSGYRFLTGNDHHNIDVATNTWLSEISSKTSCNT